MNSTPISTRFGSFGFINEFVDGDTIRLDPTGSYITIEVQGGEEIAATTINRDEARELARQLLWLAGEEQNDDQATTTSPKGSPSA